MTQENQEPYPSLHAQDRTSWTECIWFALSEYREKCIPEGDKNNDDVWDDICTSMAWIEEELEV